MKGPSSSATPHPKSSSSTSSLSPHPATCKKEMTCTTTLFDIYNIVNPPSIASNKRIEMQESKSIITPSWHQLDEKWGSSVPQPLEMQENMAMEEDEEKDLTNAAFEERHSSDEVIEKERLSSFIIGSNNQKITCLQSVIALKSPGSGRVNINFTVPAGDESTAAHPSSKVEPNFVMLQGLVSWSHKKRTFPLGKEDVYYLEYPPSP